MQNAMWQCRKHGIFRGSGAYMGARFSSVESETAISPFTPEVATRRKGGALPTEKKPGFPFSEYRGSTPQA